MQRWILRERCGGKLTCTLSFLLPSPRCSMNQLTSSALVMSFSASICCTSRKILLCPSIFPQFIINTLLNCQTCPCATGLLTSRLSLSKTYCCVTTSVQFLSTSSPRWVSSQPFSLTRAVTCALKPHHSSCSSFLQSSPETPQSLSPPAQC